MTALAPTPASNVVVFRPWTAVPTFHSLGPYVLGPVDVTAERRHYQLRTACGRVWDEWWFTPGVPGSHRDRPRGQTMRRDHAEKIGSPCSQCVAAIEADR